MLQKYPALFNTLFVISIILAGFLLGAFISAQYLVPKNSGLAGPFMVLGYGIVGAFSGLGVGLLLRYKLPPSIYGRLRLPMIVVGLACAIFIIHGVLKVQDDSRQQKSDLITALPPFTLKLDYRIAEANMPLLAFSYDTATESFNAVKNDRSSCAGKIPNDSNARVALIAALRHLETLLINQPALCPTGEPVFFDLAFEILDPVRKNKGAISVSGSCLKAHKEIFNIASSIEKVYMEYQDQCL